MGLPAGERSGVGVFRLTAYLQVRSTWYREIPACQESGPSTPEMAQITETQGPHTPHYSIWKNQRPTVCITAAKVADNRNLVICLTTVRVAEDFLKELPCSGCWGRVGDGSGRSLLVPLTMVVEMVSVVMQGGVVMKSFPTGALPSTCEAEEEALEMTGLHVPAASVTCLVAFPVTK